jgi:hypothetical protein
MTRIDRVWLTVIAVRQAIIALLFLRDSGRYEVGQSFIVVADIVPIVVWGVVFLAASLPAFVGIATGRPIWGRWAIIISLMLSAYWTVALLGAQIEARATSWLFASVWGALTAKDAILAFTGLGTNRLEMACPRPSAG